MASNYLWRRCLAGTPGALSTFPEVPPDGHQVRAVPPGFKPLSEPENPFLSVYGKYGYVGDLYGHFGQACVHTRNNFDLESAPGIAKYRAYIDEAADLVRKMTKKDAS